MKAQRLGLQYSNAMDKACRDHIKAYAASQGVLKAQAFGPSETQDTKVVRDGDSGPFHWLAGSQSHPWGQFRKPVSQGQAGKAIAGSAVAGSYVAGSAYGDGRGGPMMF